MDVARRKAAAELVAELLGEPEVEGELIGAEIADGRAVDVGERDVAQGEVTQGHADGLALVELAGAAEVGKRHVVDQGPEPRRISHVGLEGLVGEGHPGRVPGHGGPVRGQGHTGIAEGTAPGIRGDHQERHGRGDGVQLELLGRLHLGQLGAGVGARKPRASRGGQEAREGNPGSHGGAEFKRTIGLWGQSSRTRRPVRVACRPSGVLRFRR